MSPPPPPAGPPRILLLSGRAGHHRGQPRGHNSDHRLLLLPAPRSPRETATHLGAALGDRGNEAEDIPDRERARRQNTAGGVAARPAEGGSSFRRNDHQPRRQRSWCWEIVTPIKFFSVRSSGCTFFLFFFPPLIHDSHGQGFFFSGCGGYDISSKRAPSSVKVEPPKIHILSVYSIISCVACPLITRRHAKM